MPASSSVRTPGATRAPPTKAATTGIDQPSVAPAMVRATLAASVAACGVRSTSIASALSLPSVCSAWPYRRASASPTRSTGLPSPAVAGSPSASRRRSGSAGGSMVKPAARAASVATMPRPPPLVTTTSRRPRGIGWLASPRATSNSSSTVPTRSAPACRTAASKARSDPASAPVCEETARAPSAERPAFSSTTGLTAAARRSASRNRRPSATPSM